MMIDSASAKPSTCRVVLSGGPGVGKTSILRRLQELGHAVQPEVFTELFDEAAKAHRFDALFEDPLLLVRRLIARQQELERDQTSAITFFDRGMIDIAAFADNLGLERPPAEQAILDTASYNLVFIPEPLPRACYQQNQVRRQTYDASLLHHQNVVTVYRNHFRRQGRDPDAFILTVPPMLSPESGIDADGQVSVERRARFVRDKVWCLRASVR